MCRASTPMPPGAAMANEPVRILGVDPGLRATGVGVIDCAADDLRYVACGTLRPPVGAMAERLAALYRGLGAWIDEHGPHCAAIETAFVAANAASALKIGQARGALVCACAGRALPVHEYAPRAMKLALTGHGNAEKGQVQRMVQRLLELDACPQADAADALGLAICHAHAAGGRA